MANDNLNLFEKLINVWLSQNILIVTNKLKEGTTIKLKYMKNKKDIIIYLDQLLGC